MKCAQQLKFKRPVFVGEGGKYKKSEFVKATILTQSSQLVGAGGLTAKLSVGMRSIKRISCSAIRPFGWGLPKTGAYGVKFWEIEK